LKAAETRAVVLFLIVSEDSCNLIPGYDNFTESSNKLFMTPPINKNGFLIGLKRGAPLLLEARHRLLPFLRAKAMPREPIDSFYEKRARFMDFIKTIFIL
jgi:hypothetical protein